jgi:ComF family protein
MYGIINKTNVQNVKNTMIDSLLSLLAPHLCYDCHKIGDVLCGNCKYNIIDDNLNMCIMCGMTTLKENICIQCSNLFEHAWCIAERRDVMKQMLNDYKFERMYAARRTLADLLVARTPLFSPEVTVVPIPTVTSHVRQRGYDQTLSIARVFAKKKGLTLDPFLKRKTATVQTGHTRKERHQQARNAFILKKTELNGIYLLIDDVVTTGATLQAAATLLRQHGADEVWAAVLARQPLD